MKRTGLGRILWWAAPILLAVGIASRAADLREIAASLVGVKPGWVAAALVLGVLFTLNQGALYRAIFRLFDVRISLRESVRLALVMAFGSLAPAGTVAGIAYFVSTAREHGIPGPRAILTSLAFYLFDYGALLPVVAAGVTVLLTHHGAEVRLVTAGGIVLLITAAVGGALLWGLADGRAQERPQLMGILVGGVECEVARSGVVVGDATTALHGHVGVAVLVERLGDHVDVVRRIVAERFQIESFHDIQCH